MVEAAVVLAIATFLFLVSLKIRNIYTIKQIKSKIDKGKKETGDQNRRIHAFCCYFNIKPPSDSELGRKVAAVVVAEKLGSMAQQLLRMESEARELEKKLRELVDEKAVAAVSAQELKATYDKWCYIKSSLKAISYDYSRAVESACYFKYDIPDWPESDTDNK